MVVERVLKAALKPGELKAAWLMVWPWLRACLRVCAIRHCNVGHDRQGQDLHPGGHHAHMGPQTPRHTLTDAQSLNVCTRISALPLGSTLEHRLRSTAGSARPLPAGWSGGVQG